MRPNDTTLPWLTLDPRAPAPIYRQLYDALRAAILAGRLPAGTRLPATRTLARQLAIARNTVLSAFEQLTAEGYLTSQHGSGTYVASDLPDDLLTLRTPPPTTPTPTAPTRALAHSAARLTTPLAGASTHEPRAFRPGLPALDHFPGALWARLSGHLWRRASHDLLGYSDPAGYPPLRAALAEYLQSARGVQCTPAQVLIVSGSQHALYLAARLLLDPGDAAWLEDPGYLGARGALRTAGAHVVPIPVNAEGLDLAAGITRAPHARLAYVSPSHQYPLGVTMSLARRLALLDWAARAGAWIIEDDYDSEFRYAGRPLAALQGLDRAGRVLYIGTFSKVLCPALRLGYLVVPPDLVAPFSTARALTDRHAPVLDQAVLAQFIQEGHFARHVRRMRTLYAERQAALVDACTRTLAGPLRVAPSDAGMHLVGWLAPGTDDAAVSARAAAHAVSAAPLSRYRLSPDGAPGLLLGYAGVSPAECRAGVRRLARALEA